MCFIRHGLLIVGLFLIMGAGNKIVKGLETDTKPIVPEYVVNAKDLLGISLKTSEAKVRATTDFRGYMSANFSFAPFTREYGRITPYFTEAQFNPIETHTLNHKAYLSLGNYIL